MATDPQTSASNAQPAPVDEVGDAGISMTTVLVMLVVLGVVIAAAGLVFMILGKTNLPLGRLPGDILYRGKHTTFYFPLATSILLSVVLSLVFYLIGRFRH